MPKETVQQKAPNHRLEFRWAKGEDYAQLGVDLNSKFLFKGEEEEGYFTGLFFTFHTREEINDTIKYLRKMRDGAFGKDE